MGLRFKPKGAPPVSPKQRNPFWATMRTLGHRVVLSKRVYTRKVKHQPRREGVY